MEYKINDFLKDIEQKIMRRNRDYYTHELKDLPPAQSKNSMYKTVPFFFLADLSAKLNITTMRNRYCL